MNKIIMPIKSRTDVYTLSNKLNKYGIANKIVPTPERYKVACSLAIEIDSSKYSQAISIAKQYGIRINKAFRG